MKAFANIKSRYAEYKALDSADKVKAWKEGLINNAIYLLIIIAVIYTYTQNSRFLSVASIVNIISLSAANIPIACGIAGTIVLTGTDLSAGRVVGLTACISASLLQSVTYATKIFPDLPVLPIPLVILIVIVVGGIVGWVNGFFVAKFHLHPFIVTLATQLIVYGILLMYIMLNGNNGNKLKFIQLSQVDDHQLIVVIVMEGNIVKNQIVTLDEPLSNEALLKLNMLLNTSLNGTSLEQINLGVIARLKEQAGIHSGVMSSVLDAVANVIQLDDDMEIYTSGATNIFKYPELSDKQSAQEIISAFEEKQQLAALVTKSMANGGEDRDIQVYIGDESNVENMKDCSVVTATYELGEGMQGTIGIIGPKRMDYEHVMKTLKTLMAELDDIFHRDEPKKLE